MDVSTLNRNCIIKLPTKQRGIFRDKDEICRLYWVPLQKAIFYKLKSKKDPHSSDDLRKWDSENITNDVFAIFCRDKYVLREGKEIGLLATIASFTLKDFYKKENNRSGRNKVTTVAFDEGEGEEEADIFDVLDIDTSVSPERYILVDESKALLEEFIRTSSRRERDVAQAVWLEDKTVGEAAEYLGLQVANIHTHLSLMRKKVVAYCKVHNFLPTGDL